MTKIMIHATSIMKGKPDHRPAGVFFSPAESANGREF
jgi:hypothetical protein